MTNPPSAALTQVSWSHQGVAQRACWLSANNRPAPKRLIAVSDELTAGEALKHASQGTAMVWLGDFHNAKQLLAAIDRRLSKPKKLKPSKKSPGTRLANPTLEPADEFYRLRQVRAQRARVMSLILVPLEISQAPFEAVVPLPRAPKVGQAFLFGYGEHLGADAQEYVVSLQELTGILSAYQWYLNGVPVPSLGANIYPHYGTFLPTRHEYVDLVAQAPLVNKTLAFDIGTGTGVLAAVLARRGVAKVIGTDIHQRAVDCATDNFARLGYSEIASAQKGDMFPPGRAPLIVCNPPWLPGNATTTLDAAVYDPSSQMLLAFLDGLPNHLTSGGEGWLILSDLAELLGLRSRQVLLSAIERAGLEVIDRLDTVPTHNRARDTTDILHSARSKEVTSLWRLAVRS